VYSPAVPAPYGSVPPRVKSPVGAFIGAASCTLLTLVFLYGARIVFADYNEYKSWPEVEGNVLSGHVEERVSTTRRKGVTRRSTRYVPVVSYEYVVKDARYTGGTPQLPRSSGSSSRSTAEEFLTRHPVGRPTRIHVNPANPAESYLELNSSGAGWILVVLAGGLGVGAAFFGIEGMRRISAAGTAGGLRR
jgi:hypothetical protein